MSLIVMRGSRVVSFLKNSIFTQSTKGVISLGIFVRTLRVSSGLLHCCALLP